LEAPENYKISDLKNKIYYVFLKKEFYTLHVNGSLSRLFMHWLGFVKWLYIIFSFHQKIYVNFECQPCEFMSYVVSADHRFLFSLSVALHACRVLVMAASQWFACARCIMNRLPPVARSCCWAYLIIPASMSCAASPLLTVCLSILCFRLIVFFSVVSFIGKFYCPFDSLPLLDF
jgi:hypothetical protein